MKIARLAKRALRGFARGRKYNHKPFFLAVGFIRPHLPFVAPISYKSHYSDDDINLPHYPYPPVGMPDSAWNPYIELIRYKDIAKLNASGLPNTTLPDDVVLDLRQAYYSAVSYVDAMIGSVLDELDRLGLSDNTLVSLVGDHGYQLGEHGLWCKHTNFELATHAPMMFKIPGLTDKGIVNENVVEFVDIFPTLVEASGLPKLTACPDGSKYVPTCTEGQSLTPLISNPNLPWKNTAFSQYPRQNGTYEIMGYSIRTNKYRYTEWPEFSFSTHTPDWAKLHGAELYDHVIDPDENVNRNSDPGYDAIKKQISARLHAGWRASSQAVDTITVG